MNKIKDKDRYLGSLLVISVTFTVFSLSYLLKSFAVVSIALCIVGPWCVFEISKAFIKSKRIFKATQVFYLSASIAILNFITLFLCAVLGYVGMIACISFILSIAIIDSAFMLMFTYVTLSMAIAICTGSTDTVLICFIIAWASDTCGFLVGNIIGGFKPLKISENKTLSGFIASMIGGALAGMALIPYLTSRAGINPIHSLYFSLLLSTIAVTGDLYCSYYKRKFRIKDYGSIVIGHGGIMDRMDSAIAALMLSPIISTVLFLI